MPKPGPAKTRRWVATLSILVLGGIAAGFGVVILKRRDLETRFLATPPEAISSHPDLVLFASDQAKPLFEMDCAGCHGANMKGRTNLGAPDLTDRVWLYGDGGIFQIERTILYGVRSGQSKSHDITEMPAYGQRGQLNDADIRNLVQFLLQLSRRPHDPRAAITGRTVYEGAGGCYDCHATDAKGDPDYGAPDLTANVWNYGGDTQSIYNSIYFGRHGVMPGWLGKLSLEQIRALAIYIHASSNH